MRASGIRLFAAGLSLATAGEAGAAPDMVTYEMKAGDNLYRVARNHFRTPSDYRQVQRSNRIADPHSIPTGFKLRVPRALLREEPLVGHVVAFRGNVILQRNKAGIAAAVNLPVMEGDEILTRDMAFVSIDLPDKSVIVLPSQSHIRVTRLRRVTLTGASERFFEVVTGRARGKIEPQRIRDDDFRIRTPTAVSAVRGTELQVSYADGRSATEVFEGHVAVSEAERPITRQVDAGFGVLSVAGSLSAPQALLAAPVLAEPAIVQAGASLSFRIAPLAGAMHYRVQVAKDAGFLDIVHEISSGPEATLPAIDDGTWFVRIAGLDTDGLEGNPRIYSFRRRLHAVNLEFETRRLDKFNEYLFRWYALGAGRFQYRFQLYDAGDLETPIVDEPGLTRNGFILRSLAPGLYRWRVMTLQFIDGEVSQKWSPFGEVTISPR